MTRRHFFSHFSIFYVYISLNSSFHNFWLGNSGPPKKSRHNINACNMHNKQKWWKYIVYFQFLAHTAWKLKRKKYRNQTQRFDSAIPEVAEAKEENNHFMVKCHLYLFDHFRSLSSSSSSLSLSLHIILELIWQQHWWNL